VILPGRPGPVKHGVRAASSSGVGRPAFLCVLLPEAPAARGRLANQLKDITRQQMPSRLFLSSGRREDVLNILRQLDRMGDDAEDFAVVANAFGASVGSGSLTFRQAILTAAVFEFAGAAMGVGLARGFDAIDLKVMRGIFLSWIVTIPLAAVLSAILYALVRPLAGP